MFLAAALAIFITPAHASILVNESDPVNFPVFVPCAAGGAGEVVDVSGLMHVLVTQTVNGKYVTFHVTTNSQGPSGTGETTGLEYESPVVNSSTRTFLYFQAD